MARICRHHREIIAACFLWARLLALPALAQEPAPNAGTDLYDRPVLAVDAGTHTAEIWGQAVDAKGKYAVTGAADRTVRVWSVESGKLLRTIWIPAGPEDVGTIYAVAMSPDGSTIAAGGRTENLGGDHPIYLFDRESGLLVRRTHGGLPDFAKFLTFSADGRFLAATLGSRGVRVFDHDNGWGEAFRDEAYGDQSYGASFALDGRLATTSYDGKIRLYRFDPTAANPSFRIAREAVAAPSGAKPYRIAFSPDGKRLAVGYNGMVAVDVLDAATLARVGGHKPPDLQTPDAGSTKVAWSPDGRTLFAAGIVMDAQDNRLLLAWDRGGLGAERRMSYCAQNTATDVSALPDGRIMTASLTPCLGVLDARGAPVWTVDPTVLDFRELRDVLSVSPDGKVVDFGTRESLDASLRFDLRSLVLSPAPRNDRATFRPNREGLTIDGWRNGRNPSLAGHPLPFSRYDTARSLAIAPDAKRFFVSSSFGLTAFDDTGAQKWQRVTTDEVWAVNASRDGRVVVSAEGDGTIRWRRAEDGRDLLALQVLPNKKDWVLWTPEGFYQASDGAQDVLKWVTNHGPDHEATALPVSKVSRLHRPDALQYVIDELSTKGALGAADLAGARLAVQAATGSAKPPGAVLHVLAIGVDQFGVHFAADDARGVADALGDTQKIVAGKASLYADVARTTLVDEGASRVEILEAVDDLTRSMRKSADDQDVAVILFSGHGEMIENKYYLIPYGVDISTPTKMEASSVWIDEFVAKIKYLAQRGRVLLLFDACHSGAVGPGSESPVLDAGVLRDALNSNNITVLTSSNKDELSREDPAWKHGAFTKAFLDALAGGADLSNRGVISTGELAVAMRGELERLSGGNQHLGMHMNFADDVFVTGQ
jgi:WD40 repeat protein